MDGTKHCRLPAFTPLLVLHAAARVSKYHKYGCVVTRVPRPAPFPGEKCLACQCRHGKHLGEKDVQIMLLKFFEPSY